MGYWIEDKNDKIFEISQVICNRQETNSHNKD